MQTTTAFSKISTSGKAFVDESGNRFVVRGVALSASGAPGLGIDDILADAHNALMVNTIIPVLTKLNVNCIRVYQVNPQNSHALSMTSLEEAGIYVMVGLATPTYSVKQMTAEYNYGTFLHASQVVDEFQAYDNTLCFSVGNEVEFPGQQASNLNAVKSAATTDAQIVSQTLTLELAVAQAMKSLSRDIKAYITSKTYRAIPVGAAMQDGPQTSWESTNPVAYQVGLIGTNHIAEYYASGDSTERMDFIGINSYRYQSGLSGMHRAYDTLAAECSTLPVPVVLTETGALAQPRTWAIVPEMYTRAELYPQLSGQVAFQLLEEGAGYGLYDVSVIDSIVTLTASANGGAADLAAAFGKTEPSPLNAASATPAAPTTAPVSFGSNPVVNVVWPASLLTPYTVLVPDTQITIENYSTFPIQISQYGTVFGTVPAAENNQSPVSEQMKVIKGAALSIQADNGGTWDALCGVAASNIKENMTVRTDVTWGEYAGCNVDFASGDTFSINVNNYAKCEVNVVVDNAIAGTVAASADGMTPATAAIPLSTIGELNLQQTGSNDQICSVSGLLLEDGVTIENNLAWGAACNLPIPARKSINVVARNYNTTHAMSVIQHGEVLATLPVAPSASTPTSTTIQLSVINDLYMQYENASSQWINVCMAPAAALQDWVIIGDNVAVFGDTCSISYSN
jgi:hypothetical protein